MKKLIGLLLALLLTVTPLVPAAAAEDDVLMMYDAERATDVGGVFLSGQDYEYFTQGQAGFSCTSIEGYLEFFMDSYTYNRKYFDITGYEYIEFDMMSWYDVVVDLNFAVIPDLLAHHGNDFYQKEVFLPAETFVHFKIPIKDLVVYSQENPEPYDYWRAYESGQGWVIDDLHYGGSCLDAVARLRWQLAFARIADPLEEPYDDVEDRNYPEDMYIVFDNVVATKNGAGSESTMQLWADVKQQMLEDMELDQPDPIEPDVTPTEPQDGRFGDLDGDGKIAAKDALEVLKATVGKVTLNLPTQRIADVTGDGLVNAKDALEILKFTVNKITSFPVENV